MRRRGGTLEGVYGSGSQLGDLRVSLITFVKITRCGWLSCNDEGNSRKPSNPGIESVVISTRPFLKKLAENLAN